MRTPKILTTMQTYNWSLFAADLLAGLTVAMVAIPLSFAIAIASGADPAKGLVTAIVAGFLISLLGGSRVQIGGPTGAFIVVVFDGDDLMALDAPVVAHDSATVPFTIRQRDNTDMRITNLKIVVDENPMPMAAEFTFGEAMGDVTFEARVRYDVYSNIRAVAQVEDGRTFMVGRFVQAAGGCSAAVSRDPVAALATMGQMRLKKFDTSAGQISKIVGAEREVQLMIRHPNFTGMQVRSGSLDHIDARYIEFIEVKLGEELLFTMEGGFSISENPSFRFKYIDNGAEEMTVRAVDTDGSEFTQSFALRSGS